MQLRVEHGEVFGDDEPASAAPELDLPPLESITLFDYGACAVTVDGALMCWGTSEYGQLGYADDELLADEPPLGIAVELDGAVVDASTGLVTCVVLEDGRVRCFGNNYGSGSTGLGTSPEARVPHIDCLGCTSDADCCIGDDEPVLTAAALEFPEAAVAVSVGLDATCALMVGGVLRCWGGIGFNNPSVGSPGMPWGDDEPATDGPPIDVGGAVTQVTATGARHTCAVLVGGAVRCWGSASGGVLGPADAETIGDDEAPSTAAVVALPGPASEVRTGAAHACARLLDGTVWCWGRSPNGEIGHPGVDVLGDDEPIDALGPVDIGGVAVALASGNHFNCVLLDTGAARCWGLNSGGSLGYGNTENIGDDETPASAGDVPID